MHTHITGIVCWNNKTQKWQHYCLPVVINRSLIPTQMRVENRAFGFGLTPVDDWKIEKNIHYRDYQSEFAEMRRVFVIAKTDNPVVKSNLRLPPPTEIPKGKQPQ